MSLTQKHTNYLTKHVARKTTSEQTKLKKMDWHVLLVSWHPQIKCCWAVNRQFGLQTRLAISSLFWWKHIHPTFGSTCERFLWGCICALSALQEWCANKKPAKQAEFTKAYMLSQLTKASKTQVKQKLLFNKSFTTFLHWSVFWRHLLLTKLIS